MFELDHLPGSNLVRAGLADLEAGRRSPAAFLVAIATTKLRGLGVDVPAHDIIDAELELHRALGAEHADAYSRYNAYLRELVSFARALEREQSRQRG